MEYTISISGYLVIVICNFKIIMSVWEWSTKSTETFYHGLSGISDISMPTFLHCNLIFVELSSYMFNHFIHLWKPVFMSKYLLSFCHS